jgi:hypothetical protein
MDLPFCCRNNTASMGLSGAKSGNIHRGMADVDELRPTLPPAGGLNAPVPVRVPAEKTASA